MVLNDISVFFSLKERLNGYQFPVYSTESCPRNEIEWLHRSSAINCTKWNGYMCMPNENLTMLLEFCYIHPIIMIPRGKKEKKEILKCFIISIRIAYDCSSHTHVKKTYWCFLNIRSSFF